MHANSRRRYGSPRVHASLRAEGKRVGRNRVARLMRTHGIQAHRRRPFRKTTDSNHAFPPAPNLLARQFASAVAPNQVWLADMTTIATGEGWLYLAVVLDLFSRKVVGWAMSETMPQELTLAALHMAITNRRPSPGLLHHSDRGSQGEFNWSSQHPGEEGWDGRSASVGSCVAEQAAFAGTASGRAAGAPAAVLGIDCGGAIERGRGDWRRRVGAGRSTVVSEGGRHATIDACAIIEAVVWAIPVVCGAGGACNPACPGLWGAADRPAHGAIGVEPRGSPEIDDLARVAPQRCHTRRRAGLSGEHRAVAC